MGAEDEQHPGVGYGAWAAQFWAALPPLPQHKLPPPQPHELAPPQQPAAPEQLEPALTSSSSSTSSALGSISGIMDPLVVRLLWLGERGGAAESVCGRVAVKVRAELLGLGCVVVSEGAVSATDSNR